MRGVFSMVVMGLIACLATSCGGGGGSATTPIVAPASGRTIVPAASSPAAATLAVPSATPTTVAAASKAASPAPAVVPAATASPASSSTATSQSSGAVLCSHFAANPMCSRVPSTPALSPSSAAWAALLFQPGHDAFGALGTGAASSPSAAFSDPNDGSEPLDHLVPGAPTIAQTIDCDVVAWGTAVCAKTGLQGRVLNVPAGMVPAGNSDHHYSYDDATAGGEYDFWLAPMPGANGATMHVGGAGFCRWGGDGTACSDATATNIATSLGGLDAPTLATAESDPHGTLGYAVAVSALCADTSFVYPANASDGANTNGSAACAAALAPGARPPEGVRWYLDKSDAEIDATPNAPYVKVVLRTMDREHYGGTIVDTNWSGAPGFSLSAHRGDYRFAAIEAGSGTGNDAPFPITTLGIDLRADVRFCSNGTC